MMTKHGTQFTFQESQNRQKRYLKYAVQLGLPILVWSKSDRSLMKPISIGRWKQLLNMPMNGSARNGERPMETHIVQGFLRLCLSKEESEIILQTAKMKRRYLIPAEVSAILKKSISKTLTDEQERRMANVWIEFCQKEDVDQRTGCTDPDVLSKWYSYAHENYHEPLPTASPWDN